MKHHAKNDYFLLYFHLNEIRTSESESDSKRSSRPNIAVTRSQQPLPIMARPQAQIEPPPCPREANRRPGA